MSINNNNNLLNEILSTIDNLPTSKEEQEKSITVAENGITEVTSDEGKTLSKVTVNVEVEQSGGLPDWDDDSPIIASGQGADQNSAWEITEKGTLRWKIVTDTTNNKTGFTSTNLYAILKASPDYAKNAHKVRQAYVSDGFETVVLNCLPNCERVRIPVGVNKVSTPMISLKEIDLSSVGMLNDYQFNNLYTLEKATLNPLWTTLNRDSFNNCVSLRTINLENITEFKLNCLAGTINLDEVVFNEGLISLATTAFRQSGIKKAVFHNSTDSLPTIDSTTFNNCVLLRDIFVPWAEGAVANAPWGATNAKIWYGVAYVENGIPYDKDGNPIEQEV